MVRLSFCLFDCCVRGTFIIFFSFFLLCDGKFLSAAPTTEPGEAIWGDRGMDRNVVPNIEGYVDHDSLRADIEEQRRQGITVDDNNDPLPENVTPAQQEAQRIYDSGTLTMPKTCC